MIKNTKNAVMAAILSMTLILPAIPAGAAATAGAGAVIKDIEYKNGKIEVDFKRDMKDSNSLSIKVTDQSKNDYKVLYYDLDEDDLDIYVNDLPEKQTITVSISGLKSKSGTSYGEVTEQIKTDSNDIIIKKVEYEGKGKVEVEFKSDVVWKDAKVKVADENGKEYVSSIKFKEDDDHDDYDSSEDDCVIYVKNIEVGRNYTFTISGIKPEEAKNYTTAAGSFYVEKAKPKNPSGVNVKIKEMEYDFEDDEIEIDFSSKVKWNNPSVEVTDEKGSLLTAKISDKDSDDCTIQVNGLKSGNTYKVKILGIKGSKDSTYGTITASLKL